MRVARHSYLRDGQELGYEEAHRQVPTDLLAALQDAGIQEWIIWRSGKDLFHIVDCDDFDNAMRKLENEPVNHRWQETMATYVEAFAQNVDGPAGIALRHVWTLTDQASADQSPPERPS